MTKIPAHKESVPISVSDGSWKRLYRALTIVLAYNLVQTESDVVCP